MIRFAHLIRPAACVMLYWGGACVAHAQDVERERSEQAVEAYRLNIHAADSLGDAHEAVRYRITLAPLVKATDAKKLYEAAAAIADTAGLLEDEELRARQGLMELHRAKGDWRAAYEEAAKVIELTAQWQQRQAFRALEVERMVGQRSIAQRDSISGELVALRDDATLQLKAMRQQQETWKWAVMLAVLIGSLLLLVILWFSRRSRNRMRADIEALRVEMAASKPSPLNRMRERQAPMPGDAPLIEPASVTPGQRTTKEPDLLVLDIFRSMAPERLRSLQLARAGGDTDKVVRIIHTLKPQLTALDADWFGPVCAAITAPQAAADTVQWNADLDRLEQAIQEQLG